MALKNLDKPTKDSYDLEIKCNPRAFKSYRDKRVPFHSRQQLHVPIMTMA
jgi:hypothetical protein